MRQEKVLTMVKQNKINDTDMVWERNLQEISVPPKSYLQLNNKCASREMKANESEQRAKVNQNNSSKRQELLTKLEKENMKQ